MSDSDGTEVEVEAGQEEDKATAKRKTLSLRDRIKVIDHLRAQAEPIIADSNAALAVMVSNATGVDINWAQLKYMIDELPDMNLNSKVHVKSMLSTEDQLQACYERDIEFLANVQKLEAKLVALTDRVLHLEANAQP